MRRNQERWALVLELLFPTVAACVPLILDWHTALGLTGLPSKDSSYRNEAFLPLIGVGSMIGFWVLIRDWRRVQPTLPFVILAVFNAFMWTKGLAFDPCYGEPGACADIFGGFVVAVGLFVCSLGMPTSVLLGWLLGIGLEGDCADRNPS